MLEHSDLLVLSISLLKNILAVNGGEFKMDKFLKLFKENDKPTLSYWFVPSLLTLSLKTKEISKNDRIFLLETALNFLLLYQDSLKQIKKPLPQKAYKSKKMIRMISNTILEDSFATISTLIYLLENDINNTIYLNRIGSNPVEQSNKMHKNAVEE